MKVACTFLLIIVVNCFSRQISLMAPLEPSFDSTKLEILLERAQQSGIRSVSVDVWWGITEPQDAGPGKASFQWGLYDKIFARILKHKMLINPILSFHACGGNVGDQCNIPVPRWTWDTLAMHGVQYLGYFDSQGRENRERIPPWHQHLIIAQYGEWMRSFKSHYDSLDYTNKFDEVNVSLGPSGELRYPAYAFKGCGYPGSGCYQFNSPQSAIKPTASFLAIYQNILFTSGQQLVELADSIFNAKEQSPITMIGFKWPGLHWGWGNWSKQELGDSERPTIPFGILYSSGLLQDFKPVGIDSSDFHKVLAQFLSGISPKTRQHMVLHFTSLEQANQIQQDLGNGPVYVWAKPEELVRWMAYAAKVNNILLKGENALEDNLRDPKSWQRIRFALDSLGYQGITLLRMESLENDAVFEQIKSFTNAN